MSKWIDRLVALVNTKTHPENLTYKTYETSPDEQENTLQDSFVGFVGDFPDTRDAETVIERAAIQEYDGNLERDRANMEAAGDYDRNRQQYEQANPGRDPRNVEALYRAYIQRWMPDHEVICRRHRRMSAGMRDCGGHGGARWRDENNG